MSYKSWKLYVTNLDSTTTDSDLYELFKTAGDIELCVVHKSSEDNNQCIGQGFVGFRNRDDALNAIILFDSTMFKSKLIEVRLSPFHMSMSIAKGLVFVMNLDISLDYKDVHNIFSEYGNILSVRMRCRGYASVQYDCSEAAQNAIHKCHGRVINDKKVDVSSVLSNNLRTYTDDTTFNTICVLLFSQHTTEDDLRNTFDEFGKIRRVYIVDCVKKRSGVVTFVDHEGAARALDALKSNVLGKHLGYCCRSLDTSNSEDDPTWVIV